MTPCIIHHSQAVFRNPPNLNLKSFQAINVALSIGFLKDPNDEPVNLCSPNQRKQEPQLLLLVLKTHITSFPEILKAVSSGNTAINGDSLQGSITKAPP